MKTRNMVLIGTAAALGVGLIWSQDVLSHYEEPQYMVLLKDGPFEVRRYPELLSAEVVVSNVPNAENNAFRILAGYIFGKNRASEKIPMTIPVTIERPDLKTTRADGASPEQNRNETGETSTKIKMTVPVVSEEIKAGLNSEMRMRFFMPSKFDMNNLPRPVDERIHLNKVPPQTYAVVKFSGLLTKDNSDNQKVKLRQFMHTHDYEPTGEALVSAYNAPWTLPFLRRNEVWIPLVML